MMLLRLEILFIFLALFVISSESYKILGVFPTRWTSHWKIGASVMKQLATVGHDITIVSPFEMKEPNVRNAILTNHLEEPNQNMFDVTNLSAMANFMILPEVLEKAVNFTLSHPNLQKLLKEKFDLVIVEVFHSEALLGLGAHYNCPVVGVTTFGTSMYSNIMTGAPNLPSHVPNVFLKYNDRMNFWQRMNNVFTWKLDELFLYFYHYPKQRKLYENYFPNVKVPFDVQRKSLSLLLNNNHFASSTIRPSMPNIIDIGGNHVDPAKALPKDIQEFLDSADDGVILFSMGSIIQAVQWPVEKREAFVKVFGKLKQKVLWKYEGKTLPNKPNNVMISTWLPQRDILAHPNIKLFITHGGLLGATEALTEGVPVLGIPIFGDQKLNMNLAVTKGYALGLDYDDITEESLTAALDKILKNQQVSLKAKEFSRIFTDRPMSPQKTIVYWVEYVIKHKGAIHLRSAGLDMNYAEFHSLDAYGAFIVLALVIIAVCRFFIKCFYKVCIQSNDQQKLKVK